MFKLFSWFRGRNKWDSYESQQRVALSTNAIRKGYK